MSEAERKKLQQSLRELRDSARGLVSSAEAELTRVAARVVDGARKGEAEVPARVRETVHELVERVRRDRDELERRVDEGVRAAVARARRPIADELAQLRGRLENVQARLDEFARKRRRRKG
jgi:hypothetical protein